MAAGQATSGGDGARSAGWQSHYRNRPSGVNLQNVSCVSCVSWLSSSRRIVRDREAVRESRISILVEAIILTFHTLRSHPQPSTDALTSNTLFPQGV